VQPEIRKAAFEKYSSYGSDWGKAYFDKFSGGYNVLYLFTLCRFSDK
jgi:hypothetical protein